MAGIFVSAFYLLKPNYLKLVQDLRWGAEQVSGILSGNLPIYTKILEISIGFVLGRRKGFRHVSGIVSGKCLK